MSAADAPPILAFMDTMKCTDQIELKPYNDYLPSDDKDVLENRLTQVCRDKFNTSPVTGVSSAGAGHKAKLFCARCPQTPQTPSEQRGPSGSSNTWIYVSVAGVAAFLVYQHFVKGK